MIPLILDVVEFKSQAFWITEDGVVGVSLLITQFDLELENGEQKRVLVERIIKKLPEFVLVRIHSLCDEVNESFGDHARAQTLKEIGSSHHQVIMHFQLNMKITTKNIFDHLKSKIKSILKDSNKTNDLSVDPGEEKDVFQFAIEKLYDVLPLSELKEAGLKVKPISKNDVRMLFPNKNLPLIQIAAFLDNTECLIGVLKMVKLGRYGVGIWSLGTLKDQLPVNSEIIVNFKKISSAKIQRRFQKTSKQEANGENQTQQRKAVENDSALEELELHGEEYISFEFHVVITEASSEKLRESLKRAQNVLTPLGDFAVESLGTYASYVSTFPGSPMHMSGNFESITEKASVIPCYLPLFTRGKRVENSVSLTSMAYHRLDYSCDFFDPFHFNYENYSAVIIGRPGKGKSVLLGRLIETLYHDPDSRIILVDVRGSHKHLVNRLHGETYNISLELTNRLNPFEVLLGNVSEYLVETLVVFTEQLMLDEGETQLGIRERFKLESTFIEYVHSKPKSPSLNDFIEFVGDDFPRKEFLYRFGARGLSKNIFSSAIESSKGADKKRIHYYNFEQIFSAANKTLSQGVIAAVMAEFSMALFSKKTQEKLIFIADETPFFVEHCFNSFKLLNKNVRKMNGSLVLVAQSSSDLVVKNDSSLLDNTSTKIIFSVDGKKEDFGNRLALSPSEVDTIENLVTEKTKYSQFLLNDKFGSRTGVMVLSPKEYWESSTFAVDVAKMEQIRKSFNLTDREVIEILAKQI